MKKHHPFIGTVLIVCLTVQAELIQEHLQNAVRAVKEKDAARACNHLLSAYHLDPTNSTILQQLATIYFLTGNYKQATIYYEQLLHLYPTNLNTCYNLAITHCKMGQFEQAIAYLEKVADLMPDDGATKGNLLKLYLRSKRWKKANQINPSSLWWYDENISGKRIMLDLAKPGNGFGDTFQFVRYAQFLHQAGATVIVKAPKPCVPLFSLCPYITKVISGDDPLPAYDKTYSICIASLMYCMKEKTTLRIPRDPYLYADEGLVNLWHQKLATDPNIKIGICWETNLIKDRFTEAIIPSPRSISLNELKPLSMPGISFYSLQKVSNKLNVPFPLHQFHNDFDETHGRFMDTAALIKNCDLIITVDTSIAHLAGALGKPVWLLLSCESDYRWFTQTNETFWYPTMTLFRQNSVGNWTQIISKVKQKLEKLL